MLSETMAAGGRFQACVRSQTFSPRSDLALLFVAVDDEHSRLHQAWLVPSDEFDQRKGTPTAQGRYRFSASLKPRTQGQWALYRLDALQLPGAILRSLDGLEASDR